KITSPPITWSPREDSMATSTRQATNGGIINRRPLIMPPSSVGCRAAAAEGAQQLRDPHVHEIEVRVHAGGTTGVGRHDHGLRTGLLRHLKHLIAVLVVRRQ